MFITVTAAVCSQINIPKQVVVFYVYIHSAVEIDYIFYSRLMPFLLGGAVFNLAGGNDTSRPRFTATLCKW